jgi:hypothetical protein
MEYRQPHGNEFVKIAAFLKRKGYTVMDPARMGGHWIVAVKDDYVHGCIWFFGERPNAYVDYLATDFPKTAFTLCAYAMLTLQHQGCRYIRGVVRSDNDNARKFLTEGWGMASHAGYDLLFKELDTNGIPRGRTNPNSNSNLHNTGSNRPGNSSPKIVTGVR